MRQTLTVRDDISVSLPDGPVGILFSGGVESSLLVYFALMQLTKYPLHLFTVSVSFRNFNQHIITAKVLSKLCEITNNYNVYQHFTIGNSMKAAETMFYTPYDFVLQHKIINCFLVGGNANPPDEVMVGTKFFNFTNRRPWNDDTRSPYVERPLKVAPIVYAPFTNINKQAVFRLYKDNGLLESVLPLTQTCAVDPPCGECWQCFERNWGAKFED